MNPRKSQVKKEANIVVTSLTGAVDIRVSEAGIIKISKKTSHGLGIRRG